MFQEIYTESGQIQSTIIFCGTPIIVKFSSLSSVKLPLVILTFASSVIVFGIFQLGNTNSQIIEDVNTENFHQLIEKGDGIIIDVRTSQEFNSGREKLNEIRPKSIGLLITIHLGRYHKS